MFAGLMLSVVLPMAVSCDWLSEGEEGWIAPCFIREQYVATKAVSEIPDTNDFILTVRKSGGSVVYTGPYGASPEAIPVSPGTYIVRAVTEEVDVPAFDKPQYGDEQTVIVTSSEVFKVDLLCRQMNAGMKLDVASSFLAAYPKGLLYLKSSAGRLVWMYRENRTAYFNPGQVSLILDDSSKETVLLTRTLMSQDVLSLKLSAQLPSQAPGADAGVSITVDTTRNWLSDSYVIGEADGGTEFSNALSVTDARNSIGRTGVWVYGYIVGGDLSSGAGGIRLAPPFSSATNLAIAGRSNVSSKSSCLSVQLPSGVIRNELSLVSNSGNLGRRLYLKGDIVSAYYGIPGIKNITEYSF